MNRLINVVAVSAGLLWTAATGSVAVPAFLVSMKWGHAVQRLWAVVSLKMLGIDVTFLDIENLPKTGAVLAPNHESYFDILVMAALPVNFKWVAKAEARKMPFIGWTLSTMGAYFVRRDKSGHDLNVMKEAEDGLHAGNYVLIFPEGTRTRTGELLPFKKGAFRLAQNAGVPLCPIAISGTFPIAPPGRLPNRRGHHVTVRIGKPFFISKTAKLPQSMEAFRSDLTQLLHPRSASDANLERL